MMRSHQTLVLCCFISRLDNDSSAFALSMSVSDTPTGRRSFMRQAATTAGLVGATSSLSWFSPIRNGDNNNSNTCTSEDTECRGIFGLKPAIAMEQKQGIEDGRQIALEKQATDTNMQIAKDVNPLDPSIEEEKLAQEALSSFSWELVQPYPLF